MNEIRYENSWGGRMKEHIKWVDCVKVEACILVVIGHFYQSMVVSGILPDNTIYKMYLFFIIILLIKFEYEMNDAYKE